VAQFIAPAAKPRGGSSVASIDPSSFRRRVLRHTHYDYALTGTYFVTVCTHDKTESLGNVDGGIVSLTEAGLIVDTIIQSLPQRFTYVTLDEYVVMPNHVHCLLRLGDADGHESIPGHLGGVVRALKAASTRLIRTSCAPDFAWQANYYDHVVRTEADLKRIREYIAANPERWDEDLQNSRRRTEMVPRPEPWAQ
jgi:REP element-mobilizing transposase RayT